MITEHFFQVKCLKRKSEKCAVLKEQELNLETELLIYNDSRVTVSDLSCV